MFPGYQHKLVLVEESHLMEHQALVFKTMSSNVGANPNCS